MVKVRRKPVHVGAIVWATDGAPANDIGSDGDLSINTESWIIHGPKTNNDWSTSPVRGISKTQLRFNTSRAPIDDVDGDDGDIWIYIEGTDLVFKKRLSGVWTECLRFSGVPAVVVTNDGGGGDGGGD